MNVTEIFYTVFSVIFLEQNTRQIPHRFNHYQYTVGSADSDNLIHHQGRQKSEDYTKVLITTGIGSGPVTSSEVIDFSSQSNSTNNCTNFVDFPVDTFGATGQMTNLPIICGGEGRDHPSVDACYIMTKDQTAQIASMMYNRSGAASLPIMDNSALWITGGQDGTSRQLLLATEIIQFQLNQTVESASKLSIDMPLPLSGHCLIQISQNTLFLIAGKSADGPSSRTFYMHLDSTDWSSTGRGNWTEGPKLKHPRYLHSCGMQGSSKVIVSGGRNENDFEMDSVESLELQATEWIEGPRLPKPLASAAMVSIADKLYVIGGIDNGDESFSSHIYELQNGTEWSDFHRKLAVPRAGTVAIPIPDELALC